MPWVTKLEVLIGHNYIKVTNNYGYVREICNDCLFRLNGEYDRKEDCDSIYVGINRPISFGGFNPYAYHGAGVCKLEANWVCPWEDGCCENYPYGYPYYYSYPKSAAAAASSEPAPP